MRCDHIQVFLRCDVESVGDGFAFRKTIRRCVSIFRHAVNINAARNANFPTVDLRPHTLSNRIE